jgi:hypothetical protein
MRAHCHVSFPISGNAAEFVGQAVSLRRVVNPPADEYTNAAQAG